MKHLKKIVSLLLTAVMVLAVHTGNGRCSNKVYDYSTK